MDKEKAARTLVKELAKANGQNFVINHAYQNHLLENAIAAYEIVYEKPYPLRISLAHLDDNKHITNNSLLEKAIERHMAKIEESCSNIEDANYVFVDSRENLSQAGKSSGYICSWISFSSNLTPFALIGEKEERQLRKMFYKDVPREIIYSMNELGIKNFIGFYKSYKNGEDLMDYMPLEFFKSFYQLVSRFEYDKDNEVNVKKFDEIGGLNAINSQLKELGITEKLYVHRQHKDFVHQDTVLKIQSRLEDKVKNDGFLNEFFDFIFYLPYEEQNIESNKKILKTLRNSDLVIDVLIREYLEGDYFCEYFGVLDQEGKQLVVESLKKVTNRKPSYASFLWSQGFKDLELDHIHLYNNDVKGFKEYFNSQSIEEKKVILEDIMKCDSINQEVINWLEKKYYELLREVGLNG